jgi:diacylglycerol kinase (ATP)
VRIGLVYNGDAGDAQSVKALTAAIERGGHQVAGVVAPTAGLEGLGEGLDAVVAAGGDGTIGRVARGLAGSDVPLAILPMGTANNVALSLEIPVALDQAIAVWAGGRTRALDLGMTTGPWGARSFVESVGGGLVTHGIVVMDRQPAEPLEPVAQLARALRAHADVLALVDPVEWRLTLDGVPLAGEFLLVEALNMRAIGPNLALADTSSPWDGKLTVVAAGPDDRQALADYLRRRADGLDATLALPVWHAADVTVEAGARLHVDDEVMDEPGPQPVRITVEAAVVRVLVPDRATHLRDYGL